MAILSHISAAQVLTNSLHFAKYSATIRPNPAILSNFCKNLHFSQKSIKKYPTELLLVQLGTTWRKRWCKFFLRKKHPTRPTDGSCRVRPSCDAAHPCFFFMLVNSRKRGCEHKEKTTLRVSQDCFSWRKRWDSNPRTSYPVTAFRVRAVMTTSIHFHVDFLCCMWSFMARCAFAMTTSIHFRTKGNNFRLLGYYSTLFGILQQILSRCFKVADFRGVSRLILSPIRIIIIT